MRGQRNGTIAATQAHNRGKRGVTKSSQKGMMPLRHKVHGGEDRRRRHRNDNRFHLVASVRKD